MISFGQRELIDLRTVLEWGRLDVEGSRVKVLIHVGAVEPSFTQTTVQVQGHFLHAEMIGLVIQRSVESFLSQLRERVYRITDISGGYGCFRDLEQSHMAQTHVTSPQRVHGMRVGGIGNRNAVLQHIDIGRGQTDLNLSRPVGAGCVQHDISVAFFVTFLFILRLGIRYGTSHSQQ